MGWGVQSGREVGGEVLGDFLILSYKCMYTLLGYVFSDVSLCTLQEKGDVSLEEQPQRVYMESPLEQKR